MAKARIMVDGKLYKVTENLGYQASSDVYAKAVETDDGERVAVRESRNCPWRWWTANDKIQPFGRYEGQ